MGWMDIIMEEVAGGERVRGLTILRLIRLTRLARLVRVFRLKSLRELTLMVKGLFGGMATLFWAIVLLFVIIFVFGVFMTELVNMNTSKDELFREDVVPLFRSLEQSMATLFRCFTGDCSSLAGRPLVPTMYRIFGVFFAVGWIGCIMLVTFGVFNLIMAIYIENTMNAAISQQNETKKAAKKEAKRVADCTRKLMTRFYIAQKKHNDGDTISPLNIMTVLKDIPNDVQDISIDIHKEIFLTVLQDPATQKLMDDLEIPLERARLFDVFDADGNGMLGVKEIIQGFLRVRGETQRSDILAGYLSVRALLQIVRDFEETVLGRIDDIRFRLTRLEGIDNLHI